MIPPCFRTRGGNRWLRLPVSSLGGFARSVKMEATTPSSLGDGVVITNSNEYRFIVLLLRCSGDIVRTITTSWRQHGKACLCR